MEQNFTGLSSILSGPAGGVVGYALTSWDEVERAPVIGYVQQTAPIASRLPLILRYHLTRL